MYFSMFYKLPEDSASLNMSQSMCSKLSWRADMAFGFWVFVCLRVGLACLRSENSITVVWVAEEEGQGSALFVPAMFVWRRFSTFPISCCKVHIQLEFREELLESLVTVNSQSVWEVWAHGCAHKVQSTLFTLVLGRIYTTTTSTVQNSHGK